MLDLAPGPGVPGFGLPWWSPFVIAAASAVALPYVLAERWTRTVARPWLFMIPVGGVALLSWALFDVYLMELGWEQACGQDFPFFCYRAPLSHLLEGVAAASATAVLGPISALAIRRGPGTPMGLRTAAAILVGSAASVVITIVVLSFSGRGVPLTVGEATGIAFVIVGFLALGTVAVHTPGAGFARIARWLAVGHGTVSMAVAFAVAAFALGPPPVFL